MTEAHKAALAQGRVEGRAVRSYMDALTSQTAPRRGRKGRSAEELQQMLDATSDPMQRLALRPQLRAAIEAEQGVPDVDMEAITADFVKVVASYSERNGLTYSDWREEGVPAAILKEAGLRRGG